MGARMKVTLTVFHQDRPHEAKRIKATDDPLFLADVLARFPDHCFIMSSETGVRLLSRRDRRHILAQRRRAGRAIRREEYSAGRRLERNQRQLRDQNRRKMGQELSPGDVPVFQETEHGEKFIGVLP